MNLRSLRDVWRSKPARERWLIGVPVAALVAAVLWLGFWEPLQAAIARLHALQPELEQRREAIRAQSAELRAAPAATASPALRLPQIAAALARRQLPAALATIEPAGENRARLAFARLPFHALWPLLQDLQTDAGLRVVSLRVDRLDASQVRVEAVLGAGDR